MDNQEFLAFVGPPSLEIERTRGYPAEALLAQIHLESNGLREYPQGSNNVLGIKWNGVGPYVEAGTKEQDEAGNEHPETSRWQVFESVYDCLTKWADLMDQSWYAQARPYLHNWAAFLGMIWYDGTKRVYATDAYYQWKVIKRAVEVGIPEWCQAERERQNTVRLVVDGMEQRPGRLVNGSPHVHARPLLDIISDLKGGWYYNPSQRELTVTSPRRSWWRVW